jgi:hypothetical protein
MPELIYLIAWFVLPLIPAFLLFKFLPSTGKIETPGKTEGANEDEIAAKIEETAKVQGPLKGLGIKFGGAFAGYLVLFLLAKEVLNDRMKKKDDSKEVWTIKGNIVSADGRYSAQAEKPALKIDPLDQVIKDRTFTARVVAEDDGRGYLDFPMLDFTTINYKPESLPDLDFNRIKKDIDTSQYKIESFESRIIRLKNPVALKLINTITPTIAHNEEITVDTSSSNN